MKKLILIISFILGNNIWGFGEEEISLERVVITPLYYSQEIQKVPFSVTVITKSDIEKSNAQTIVDLLRPISGLYVRDYYGTGIKASADLRGFGEFAGSNTLVLVDGRRVNEIDLSGVDWTQIPLEVVEKIEVIRGGGNVLYGDNAVGGVINILTKRGEGRPYFNLNTQAGSYNTEKYVLEFGGSKERFSYLMQVNRYATNGYRKNSDYRGEYFFGKFTHDFTDLISINLSGGYKDADYGLPGALRESQLKTSSRRDTKFPEDDVGEKDGFVNLGTKAKINEALEIDTNLSFRRREVDNYLLSSQSLDHRRIDTLRFNPLAILETNFLGKEHKFTGGIDFCWVDSLIDAYSAWGSVYYQGEKTRETDIDKNSIGYYLQDEIRLRDNLFFLGGYRLEKAKYSFDSTPQPGPWSSDPWINPIEVDEDLKIDEEAINMGLNYIFRNNSKIFINYTRAFRFPATDEYYSIWAIPPVNTELLPQISKNFEIGLEHQFDEFLKVGFNFFNMKLRNELYYDPLLFANRNYDETERKGIETYAQCKINEFLTLSGNYTFTEATFINGEYAGSRIPLVPRHKGSLGSSLEIVKDWQINTLINYWGKRFFINDQANDYPPLDDYLTLDLKLNRRIKNGKFYLGINNLFNEKYSEYGAISTVYKERGYYPSPERNFILGVFYKF